MVNPIQHAQPQNVVHTYQTAHPILLTIKQIFDYTIGGLYTLFQYLIGMAACPAAHDKEPYEITVTCIPDGYTAERMSVNVNGDLVDIVVLRKVGVDHQTRWGLSLPGNDEQFESLGCQRMMNFVAASDANWVFMSYRGLWSRRKLINGCAGVLDMIVNRYGAQQFIGVGRSLGGGILRSTLRAHPLPANMQCRFIWNVTFSYMSEVVRHTEVIRGYTCLKRIASWGVQFFRWNLGSLSISRSGRFDPGHEFMIRATNDQIIPERASLPSVLGRHHLYHGNGHDCIPGLHLVSEALAESWPIV